AIVVGFTLALCVAGALVGLGLPEWFKAQGVLVIHARQQRIAEFQELRDPSPDSSFIQSEVDILQSRSVIEPVVRSLRLWEATEFQEMKYPKGWSWPTVEERLEETWRDILGPASDPEESPPAQPVVNIPPSGVNPPTQAQIDGAVLS